MTLIDEVKIAAPELRGAALELGRCTDLEVCLDGPAGSGKTVAALYKIHAMLLKYPGAKALIARKSNTALSGTAMASFRDYVLDPREGIRYFGGNKVRPAAFEYPNGSMIIVSGLDKPEKVKSLEIDLCFINEATELNLEDWEFVRSRLRHDKTPYRQLIADVNPVQQDHWLNIRMNEGRTTRLLSRHQDNPRFYDAQTNEWTEEGHNYIEIILGGLTGVRLSRLRYGIWCNAENSVYEGSWDRARCVIPRFAIPMEWGRYVVIDFGFTNPFVCLWAAQDPDGRLYIYRELYKTKTLVEEHAREIKRVSRWGLEGGDPLPREVICDWDAEGRETFSRHTGLQTIRAYKGVAEGIQAVAGRFRAAADGRPRVFIFNDALYDRDPELAKMKKPTCLIEEVDNYRWDTRGGQARGEAPIKEDDHALDALRYLISRWDIRPMAVRYSERIY